MFSLRRDAAGKDSYLSDGYGNHRAMAFPSVMYRCESWTVKKVECEELMLLNCGVGEDS